MKRMKYTLSHTIATRVFWHSLFLRIRDAVVWWMIRALDYDLRRWLQDWLYSLVVEDDRHANLVGGRYDRR